MSLSIADGVETRRSARDLPNCSGCEVGLGPRNIGAQRLLVLSRTSESLREPDSTRALEIQPFVSRLVEKIAANECSDPSGDHQHRTPAMESLPCHWKAALDSTPPDARRSTAQ